MIQSKNILLISPEPWDAHLVSKHHYARELAKNNHVFFLDPPSNKKSNDPLTNNLSIVRWKNHIKGIKYFPDYISGGYFKKEVNRLQKFLNTTFDIIWNFDPSRFFNLSKINTYNICHIVDWNQQFQRKKLAETSDLCLVTTDFLKKELLKYNIHTHKIHHGVQLTSTTNAIDLPQGKNTIKVGMIGNLNRSCIDWSLIDNITQNAADFYFMGRSDNGIKEQYDKENIYWLGKQRAVLIPDFLAKMDILICCYKLENTFDITQHASLHKTMEYLGSGNVIVTTYQDEYKDKTHLLEMVNPDEDFLTKFILC